MTGAESTGPGGLRRQRRARALADPTRFRVYEAVGEARDGVDVATLTERFGLHHTAIRQHLQHLAAAGLVEEHTAAPRGRGRPRLVYRAAPGGRPPEQPYVDLAKLLTRAVRTGRTARDVGREAGRAAVAHVTDGTADSAELIASEAHRLGFEPSVATTAAGVDILLGTCPFADVAADDPKTVCALHLGLAEGVTEALGDERAVALQVGDPHAGGCRLTLREPRGSNRGRSAGGKRGGPRPAGER